MRTTKATPINKEDIKDVAFVHHEVLNSPEAIEKRFESLDKAMHLGNGYKSKARIIFETTEGLREVETTVWVATPDAVSLKGDVFIPVNCIHDVIM